MRKIYLSKYIVISVVVALLFLGAPFVSDAAQKKTVPQPLTFTMQTKKAGTAALLTWKSNGMESCAPSGDWKGKLKVSGVKEISPSKEISKYTIKCLAKKGKKIHTASVTFRKTMKSTTAPPYIPAEHFAPPVSKEVPETHPLHITGDALCVHETNTALSLLKKKAPSHYEKITSLIGIIECSENGYDVLPWETPSRLRLDTTRVTSGSIWYAGVLAYNSCYFQKHRAFITDNPAEPLPRDLFTRNGGEIECLNTKYNVLVLLEADKNALTYLKEYITKKESKETTAVFTPPITEDTPESHPIKIIGDALCVHEVNKALSLLKKKTPDHYNEILARIGSVECVDARSAIYVWETPPRYVINKKTLPFADIIWDAGAFPHEACHTRLYQEYVEKNPNVLLVPEEVYGKEYGETECLKPQYDALERLGAEQYVLDYIKNEVVKKRWWEVPYKKRDW